VNARLSRASNADATRAGRTGRSVACSCLPASRRLVALPRAPHEAGSLLTHGPPDPAEEATAEPRWVRSEHEQPWAAFRCELHERGEGAGASDEQPLHVHSEGACELGRGAQRSVDIWWVVEVVVAEPYRHGKRRQLDYVGDDERLASFDGGVDGELAGILVEGNAEEGGKEDGPAVATRPDAGRPRTPELRAHVTRDAAASSGGCGHAASLAGASAACSRCTTQP